MTLQPWTLGGGGRQRSHELQLDRYDTDKIQNGYLEYYDPILAPFVDESITLLELGIFRGGSLVLWRDYFPNAQVAGIDLKLPANVVTGDRIHTFQGSQADTQFLASVARQVAPDGFDVIIDDASHIASLTVDGFWQLFEHHLKPGGLYVIEDWGTGYWSDWPDGSVASSSGETLGARLWRRLTRTPRPFPSHHYGMVGWVKQLVDEQGVTDLTRGAYANPPGRPSKFWSVTVTPSIVFIRKRAAV